MDSLKDTLVSEDRDRGSFSLTMLYSTMGGLLFVMLFYNLVGYVSSSAAVHEAARKAARCLSPTDPECVDVLREAGVNPLQQWYGYASAENPEPVMVTLDYYRYYASMENVLWGANYSTFEINKARQPLSWQTAELPVRTFQAKQIETVPVAHPRYVRTLWTPKHAYPVAEIGNRDVTIGQFGGARRNSGFQTLASYDNTEVQAGSTFEFVGVGAVPALGAALDESCVPGIGVGCNAAEVAGGDGVGHPFQEWAFVAFKVFAYLDASSGKADVTWAKEEGESGVFITVWDKDGKLVSQVDDGELGGRDNQQISSGPFNLRLRGPDKSPFEKTGDHANLYVPRGGSYKISAFLKVAGHSVKAKVDILASYDDYQPISETLACAPVELSVGAGKVCPKQCAPIDGKSFDSTWHFQGCGWGTKKIESRSRKTIDAVVCDNSWRPSESEAGLNQGATFNGWEVIKESKIEVPGNPARCPLASNVQNHKAYCADEVVFNSTNNSSACSALLGELNSAKQSVKPYSGNGSVFTASDTPVFERTEHLRWEPSWVPQDQNGMQLSFSLDQVRETKKSLANNFIKRLARSGGAQQAPSVTEFLGEIKAENPQITAGWNTFSEGASKYIQPKEEAREDRAITTVYPFKEAVPELYYGQVDASKGWDFDRDCNSESSCQGEYAAFSDLTQALRHYASIEVPEAADLAYQFKSGVLSGPETKAYESVSDKQFASCTPTRMLCSETSRTLTDRVSLGTSRNMPEGCSSGQYYSCYSEPIGTEYTSGKTEVTIAQEKVQEVALTELQNVIPYAIGGGEAGCEGKAACASVNVSFSDNKRAEVSMEYQMPLSFPFNAILGRDTLPIRYVKSEVLERAAVGRQD